MRHLNASAEFLYVQTLQSQKFSSITFAWRFCRRTGDDFLSIIIRRWPNVDDKCSWPKIFANVVRAAAAAAALVVAAVAEIARKRSLQRCSLANCAEYQYLITPLMCNWRIIVIVENFYFRG